MPNGECAVGASNKAKIENLEREQMAQNNAIQKVSDKLDKINWWLVATLGGVVVNLILQLAAAASRGTAGP